MPKPQTVLVLPVIVPRSFNGQLPQFAMNACAPPFLVYARPVTCPLLLMAYPWLQRPPSVPIFVIFPLLHTKPKKLPVASYDVPVTTPKMLMPVALFHQSLFFEPSV